MIWLLANWKVLLAALAIVLSFGGGWQIRGWHDAADEKAAIQQAYEAGIAEEKRTAEIDRIANQKLAADREAAEKINHDTEVEIAKSHQSYDCKLPVGGVRLYRQALGATAR